MWDTIANATTILSAVFGALAGFVSGWLSVKVTLREHEVRLNNQRERNAGFDRADETLRLEGRKQADELLTTERKLNGRIADVERAQPNCEAHKQEILRAVDVLRTEVRGDMLAKTAEIAKTNAEFREELRIRFMADSQAATKEFLSPVGVGAIVNAAITDLRRSELHEIFGRLHDLETKK